jgi:hypothetical protein
MSGGSSWRYRLRQRLPEAHIEFVDDANHITRVDQQDNVEKLLVGFPK